MVIYVSCHIRTVCVSDARSHVIYESSDREGSDTGLTSASGPGSSSSSANGKVDRHSRITDVTRIMTLCHIPLPKMDVQKLF